MQNGYFKLVSLTNGFGVKIIPPKDGGAYAQPNEIMLYLDRLGVSYNPAEIKKAILSNEEKILFLSPMPCPPVDESYTFEVSADEMTATAYFTPPSTTGKRITMQEILTDLKYKNITMGIQFPNINDHLMSEDDYGVPIILAKGKEPKNGTDAYIEYYFNTELHVKPTINEDGSADYHNLNMINHIHTGDLLAKIIPAVPGEEGFTIYGARSKPRELKRVALQFGNNILLSEDRMSITSQVDGHVVLVEGKVFVSDVYEVENVDNSVGDINFTGSVQVNGNVMQGFSIKAGGNIIVNGVVEGASLEAGGSIIIARGVHGMGKAKLNAGGDIIAKFLENSEAKAEGYISVESILHSNVQAGTYIDVTGKKGFVTGGHVQASEKITVKTLGSEMGASTIVEVGVNPAVKTKYMQLNKEITELNKAIKAIEPTLLNFTEKRASGANFRMDQIAYIKGQAMELEQKKAALKAKMDELDQIADLFDPSVRSVIEVTGVVYPGTTIVVSDASMLVNAAYKFCRFEKRDGDVKAAPL